MFSASPADAVARIKPKTRVAPICTGAFLLAAVGMLDGLLATTHWKSADKFLALFPIVRLNPDVLYTDEGRILTSAGEAGPHLIRDDHGAGVTNDVAPATVVPYIARVGRHTHQEAGSG